MTLANRLGALVAVLLMVTVSFQTAVASAYEDGGGDGSRVAPMEGIPGPFRELDKLVEGLLEVTVDHTDTDSDGLPDTVEAVIGTDPKRADTDLDNVLDMAEVANRTDPTESDSNHDGVPDGNEAIDGVVDSDGDGTPNAWTDDNDGDGVVDTRDLSPYAATPAGFSHHIELESSGAPTTISLQLRTNDPDTMRLIKQKWDWPYDTEGAMRDLDNSTDDVTAVPILVLKGTGIVNGSGLEEYGVVVVGDVAYVPLYPIEDQGGIIALQGQMFLPEGDGPRTLSVDASLKWKVTGMSDSRTVAIEAANGLYLTLEEDGSIETHAPRIDDEQRFELVDLTAGKYAIRANNGRYLNSKFGSDIRADGTKIDAHTTIEVERRADGKLTMGMQLPGYDKGFLLGVAKADGLAPLEPIYSGDPRLCGFTWEEQSPTVHPIPLAVYPESFTLAGLYAQEDHGTDVALVYHNTSAQMGVAANAYLAYQFLRNVTTTTKDLQDLFMRMNDDFGVIYASFRRMDLAMKALAQTLSSAAKAGFTEGELLPVITCIETRYAAQDLASIGQGRVGADGASIDVASQPVIYKKILKTTWYNGTSDEAAPIEDVLYRMLEWELGAEDLATLMTLATIWSIGEQVVISIGAVIHPPLCSEAVTIINTTISVISSIKTYSSLAFNVVYYGIGIVYTAYNLVLLLPGFFLGVVLAYTLASSGWYATWTIIRDGAKTIYDTWSAFSSATTGFLGFLNWVSNALKWLCVIGLVIGLASAAVTIYAIGAAYEWSTMGTFTAVLYGVMMAAWAIFIFVLALLSFIPKVGVLFTILSTVLTLSDTIVGLIWGRGWTKMLMDLIVDLVTDVDVLTDWKVSRDTTEVFLDDADGDGVDVGDRFVYKQTMVTETWYDRRLSRDEVNTTHILPATRLSVPEGSGSTTGFDRKTNVYFFHDEYRCSATTSLESWVDLGTPMPNFPITIMPATDYNIIYEESWWLLWWHTERKVKNGTATADPVTIYLDVLPGGISAFARWRGLASRDSDGDGIADTDEPWEARWSWDADGDGLGDAFERETDTNATAADSDHDGLNDKAENREGTDPWARDSDLDELTDAFELAGWVVNFTYCGREFFWHVWSDPLMNDTDGDGLDDRMEFLTKQNPRSRDTDGDWNEDSLRDYTLTSFDQMPSLSLGHPGATPVSIAVAPDGSIYALVALPGDVARHIHKWAPNGTFEREFGNGLIAQGNGITCNKRGQVFVADEWYGVLGFYGDGSAWDYPVSEDPFSHTNCVWSGKDVAVDGPYENDYYVYDSGIDPRDQIWMTKITYFNWPWQGYLGSPGPGLGSFGHYGSLVFDPQGLLHVLDSCNNRVLVYNPNLTFVRTYNGVGEGQNPFNYPCGLAFAGDGSTYLAEQTAGRVQLIGPDSRWVASIDSSTTSDGLALSPRDVQISHDGAILVADGNHDSILRFRKNTTLVQVPQQPFTDTDGDGLGDAVEHVPWAINITTEGAGTVPLLVSSDPNAPDTDGDGLGDLGEHDLGTDPRSIDTDADGAPDLVESDLGTNPCDWDTDRDGLADGVELAAGTDPQDGDTDGEGLGDREELLRGSDPLSGDTDRDGLGDAREADFGSNLTDADSDEDCMFDGRESDAGTLPYGKDFDDDGIQDGYEDVYGTEPTDDDTDADSLPDGLEVAMRIDPLSDDTDDDGVDDGAELERGLDPRSGDTDRDGVPDGEDAPSQLVLEGTVHLVLDQGADAVGLADALGEAANVEMVAPDHLLANHTDARYIVILGDPARAGAGTAGALIRTLLADAPDVLARLKDPSESDHIAVRYGKWAPNQTIVMLPRAYMSDHFRVLGLLRGVSVTVGDGVLTYACADPRPDARLDGVDVVKATGAAVWARFDDATAYSIEVRSLSGTDLAAPLTARSGLAEGEIPLGRYAGFDVNSIGGAALTGATVWLYYTASDLDRTGDGDANDDVDIDEARLGLYVLDEASGTWTRLSTALGWVLGTGVDTADRDLYGARYAGVLWANVTHLSVFGAGGPIRSGVRTVARAGPDQTARAGDQVMFDGSASTGIGGVARYDWTFVERGKPVVLHGFRPVYTFKEPGTYGVKLRISDSYGGTSEASMNVTVGKAPAERAPWGVAALAVAFLLVLAVVLWFVFTPVGPSGRDESKR